MDVQQLCTMNFGILVDSILLYVRLADYCNFKIFVVKPKDILWIPRIFKASKIVNCELKRQSDLEFDFMAGLVILSRILNQRFYFALIMTTLTNVIRKYAFSLTVPACGTTVVLV